MVRYDNLHMDFCDSSLVYLATPLKIRPVATLDMRDFTKYRLPDNKPSVHVLEPKYQPLAEESL